MIACNDMTETTIVPTELAMEDIACSIDILILLVSEEGDFIATEDNNLISLENG